MDQDKGFKSELESGIIPRAHPSKHKEEIPNVPLAIFFIRNGNHKEILSKIFISAKKERPGKG